ncbi:hypothetical protein SBRCBS47491_002652 [Sporothrix bragantina]|uniref:Uncharacterized protein n=1 Tax=Sporothrix bragantina TaxID=671064 RepID=A0ABP0B8R1_9PEZI
MWHLVKQGEALLSLKEKQPLSFSRVGVVCKRVITRVRHRPGFAATLALVLIFCFASLQYGSLTPFSASWSSETQRLQDCSSSSITASLWPWCSLQKQEHHRHEGGGKDPEEIYPSFRELEKGPDPLHREFVAWHGKDYVHPPKPKYKKGHSPKELKAAVVKMEKALELTAGVKDNDKDTKTGKTEKTGKDAEEKASPKDKAAMDKGLPRPIADPFPLLSQLDRASIQHILPPQHNTKTRTPLFIGFTRNWPLLLQCVSSYMAAGWPARDIYVVENTGTMGANKAGRLSLQNPFFLNHTQLVDSLGINVIETPTLFTFAQLQNFYLYTAQQMGWLQYFWSHQDVVVFSEEGYVEGSPASSPRHPFTQSPRSLHHRALATLKILTHRAEGSGGAPTWATHFFDYDRLTLVNVPAYLAVGGWDTHISFYAGDCDMYLRLKWAGYWQGMLLPAVGLIYDVAGVLDDLGALFHAPGVDASVGGGWGAPGVRQRRKMANEPGQHRLAPHEALVQHTADLVHVVQQMHRAKNNPGAIFENALEPLVEASDDIDAADAADGTAHVKAIKVAGRNAWQQQQQGGQGEPFYRDPAGFEAGLQKHIAVGRQVYAEKWGHRGCDLHGMGIRTDDAWHLERDWDGSGSGGGGW